jgi:hypothetical protein
MANDPNDFVKLSGDKPVPSTDPLNPSYTSADGRKIYLQFDDIDSTGLSPSTGTHLRFSVTKINAGSAVTVTPTSTSILTSKPKQLVLNLSAANKIVDGFYNGAGVVTSVQQVYVSYDAAGFGATVPLLGDDDTTRSLVDSFSGFGISNRTEEANGPVFLYAFSSYDGYKITSVFREATPSLSPYTGISGFAVTQNGNNFTINNAYVLDPSSATDGKKVVIELADQLSISDPITLSYAVPTTSPKLTDSTSLKNVTVAFAGAAVTNLVEETTKPTIISAETNTGGIGRTVFVKMSELTNPNSPSGFDVKVNNLSRTFSATAGTTSYLSTTVTQYALGIGTTFTVEDILTLSYTKPTSNFIVDRTNNQNPLDSLTDPISVSNLLTDTTAPSLVAGESYVDRNGLDIYAKFSENASVPLLPVSNISGFRIEVNGVFSGIRSATSLNTSVTNDTVKITLYNKIHKNDVVKIAYIRDNPPTTNSLRDTSGNYVESFQPVLISNRTLDNTFGFFDPLEWESDINYNLSGLGNTTFSAIGTSSGFFESFTDLFSKEERYPGASVILDTHPPYGTVIINRNANASDAGIRIHEFGAFGEVIDYSTFTDYNIANLLQGWQYISDADQNLSQVSFKLKKTGTISNSGDVIEFLLFSGNEPGTLVGKLGQIIYGDLTDSYKTFSFTPSDIKLSGSTSYWFVISVSTLPISTSGTVNVYTAQISKQDGIIAYYNSTTGKWIKTLNSSGYVKISASNIEGEPLSGRDIMLDILENPIRDANSFGGSNEKEFEVIGDTQFNYILKKLNKITDTTGAKVYPEVTNIVIGATSAVPKNFSVEVKTTPTSEWLPVFDTISDEDTLEFLNYKFDTPQRLCQIRLSYRGDYFTLDQTGELTLAAKDDLSNIVSAQISHFPDFRDSVDFQNADVRGFIDFRQGVTEYSNFSITNSADIWTGQTTYGSSEILASINFGSKVIVACNNKIFVYGSNEIKTVSNNVFLEPEDQINCFAVYKNKVYCGTSNGLIYSSYNGEFWTLVNSINPLNNAQPKYIKPVSTMSVLGKYLYIGTSKGTTSQASIYSYDGKSILKLSDFDFNVVSASASFANLIFFGMSDGYAVNNSAIYKYNGLEFTRTLATDFDSVDSLCYSSSKKAMIAAFRGGEIWELPYNSNNDPLSWALAYSTYADRIYSIVDDTAGSYTYIATDNGLYGYFKSLDQFKSITSYNFYTPNLNVIYRDYLTYALSESEDQADIESNDQIVYGVQVNDLNYNDYSTEIPASFTNTTIELEGAIKAEASTTYSFRLETNMGIKMYLNDSLVVNEYTEQTSDQIYDASQTFTVRDGEFIKIKIKAFVSDSTTPSLRLLWNDENLPEDYTIIPSSQYFRSNKVKSVHNFLTDFVGCGSDGNVYTFDPSFYETKIRRVYVRFKDEAGNIHGIVLPGKTAPYPVIQDKITQDLKTKNGLKVSSGKIFQVKQNSNYILSTRSVYTPRLSNYSIYAPDRKVRSTGSWEVQPFYIPSLSQWGNLTALILNKYGLNDLEGLDAGTEVKIYVRSGSSRESVLSSDYSSPFVLSYINNSNTPTTASTFQVPLQTFGGKWLQYKIELISATQNLSPEVLSVTVNYTAATGSYFFTKMFNAADYSTDPTAPTFRRGLLTSNDLPNGGTITYGYTTDNALGNTFDFSKFTEITPNKTFDLSSPSSKIRFGIMFTAVGAYPSVVYDFAVQLDAGNADLKMMPGL